MQSAPSTDPEFVALMRAEAEALVPTRVHHPSLLIWGGGNELDEGGVPLSDDRSPVLAALSRRPSPTSTRTAPGCRPRRPVPSSTTGSTASSADPDGQHDVHGPWEHQGLVAHYTLANAGTSLAHTEFGVEGMTNLRSLEALVPEADRWPADRTNPVLPAPCGEWWNNADQVVELFGGRPDSLETLNRASQLLQATGLQYSVEADRRRFPRCSMVLAVAAERELPQRLVHGRGRLPRRPEAGVLRGGARLRAAAGDAARGSRGVGRRACCVRPRPGSWAEDAVAEGVDRRAASAWRSTARSLAERAFLAPAIGRPARGRDHLACRRADAAHVFLWEADGMARTRLGMVDRERMLATSGADFARALRPAGARARGLAPMPRRLRARPQHRRRSRGDRAAGRPAPGRRARDPLGRRRTRVRSCRVRSAPSPQRRASRCALEVWNGTAVNLTA